MTKPRTLIIGIDGATFDIVAPWIEAGFLPTLAKLMRDGTHGKLLAWPNMNSAAAWTSMVTGYNSGQHGVFDFGTAAPQRGTKWTPTTALSRAKTPFWSRLSAAGQQVGVVNVPITYPADKINGFMLAGMDAPGLNSTGFAHPPELLDELRRLGIDYVLDVPKLVEASRRDPHRVPDQVSRMVDARAQTILHLMETQSWDVLMAVFIVTDRMQHFYWPDEDASLDGVDWSPIRSIYQQIDTFLSDALKLLDEDTTVLIVSDHGFGPSYPVTSSLNNLFEKLGLVHYRKDGGSLKGWLLKNLLAYGRKLIPASFQPIVAQYFPKLHVRALSETVFAGIDWSSTRVFVHPYGGQVFINLKGRNPEGIVPAQEYGALRDSVRDILLSLTDADTGKPLIRAVHRREDLYHGPYADKAADLHIQWDYDALGRSLHYPIEEKPLVIIQQDDSGGRLKKWKGTHRSEGIFIAHGPHVKPGATIANARIYDIAPTVLHNQRQAVPNDLDGHVLTDIFTDEYLQSNPVTYTVPGDDVVQDGQGGLDEKEAGLIEDRLRDLGYIE